MIQHAAHPLPPLSLLETRVLGVLVEKQLTTPDVYPLTVNSLVAGCNQKTSRDPVINASENDVQIALDSLRTHTLIVESYGASGRVLRYAHNVDRVLHLPGPIVAILAVLMLRGPQTPGELRGNCDRLYRFPDISALEAYLDEMAESRSNRPLGALVAQLPRQPGSREHRYAHLLSGIPEMPVYIGSQADGGRHSAAHKEGLAAEVAQLRAEVAALRGALQRLCAELGVDPGVAPDLPEPDA
ncbi:MAG: YceH family protein [Betaproteobacteria bacterium]|nr:YceH family protein [Betaproteobacteria bacterium]